MSNVNQYTFEELPDSEIIITEPIYRRLLAITNMSGLNIEEHMCWLRGSEVKKNKILFDSMNENQDYIISGSGSSNPEEHGVEPGEDTEITKELTEWIDTNSSENTVICDVHTHPSGVSEGYEYRMYSRNRFEK